MAKLAIRGGEPIRTKPFPTWPVWGEEEIQNLAEVVRSGKWGRLHGRRVAEFERRFAEFQQAKHGVAVNSGTTALRLGLMAAGLGAGDGVLVPAYTFIASATAVIEAGGYPVFVDIDPETYNIDVRRLEEALRPGVRGIMPVHFAGRPVDMDAIRDFARKHELIVVEDAAQAWGAEWRGKRVGALGDAGAFSFQSSKNINSGEGGIILTNDDTIAAFARSHHNCGRWEGGEWYMHYYYGGNFRMTEFQGAVLLAQLERYESHLRLRQGNAQYLNQKLGQIEGIRILREDPAVTSHAEHLYIFRYQKESFGNKPKKAFIDALRAEGIPASPGYSLPLYRQPVFVEKAFGPRGRRIDLPVDYREYHLPATERACFEEAVWLTQNVLLGTREDMDDIVRAVEKVRENWEELPD
ncbi:MAG: DegT/DnrJ/EryC1/StrS family aminotransferase [candidate division KSB1 bacterium]|nr:DegT/DnrJ/EryC1/StrS family aminotransferase [candidate division KSB1 bacterium]